jgi:hypothetical protein
VKLFHVEESLIAPVTSPRRTDATHLPVSQKQNLNSENKGTGVQSRTVNGPFGSDPPVSGLQTNRELAPFWDALPVTQQDSASDATCFRAILR